MSGTERHGKYGHIAASICGIVIVDTLIQTELAGNVPALTLGVVTAAVVYVGSLLPAQIHSGSVLFQRAVTLALVGAVSVVVLTAVSYPSVLATVGTVSVGLLPGTTSGTASFVGAGVLLVGGAILAVGVPLIIDTLVRLPTS